jgi:hypothetical protein
VQAAVLEPLALLRFVDGDEGVYAYAGRLALHGELPYRDFFYEQTPLLPYVYGSWGAVVGDSWYSLRTFSVLAAVGVGVLLYLHLRTDVGVVPALLAVAIYAGSALVFGFFTLVKTFALSGLLVFAAYVLAASGRRWARRSSACCSALPSTRDCFSQRWCRPSRSPRSAHGDSRRSPSALVLRSRRCSC